MATDFQQTFTVRELARLVRRDGEDLEVAVNRLRNWTKEGLLHAVGAKHPGTGKSRLYPARAVIDALVLTALTAMGMPAVRAGSSAGPYFSALNYSHLGYEQYLSSRAGADIFLIVGADGSPYDSANPHMVDLCHGKDGLATAQFVSTSDVTIIINLSNLFRRLEQRIGET